jgi:hypothetical protein
MERRIKHLVGFRWPDILRHVSQANGKHYFTCQARAKTRWKQPGRTGVSVGVIKKLRRRLDPKRRLFEQYSNEAKADEYINWACSMIGGWLEPGSGNLAGFVYALKHLPATGAIVEIGSFLGASTNVLTYLSEKHAGKRPVFNCDPWLFEHAEKPIGGYFDAGRGEFREYAKRTFVQNARTFSERNLPHSFEMTSDEFLKRWARRGEMEDLFGRRVKLGGPIAFAYVDGNHTYEASRADMEGIVPHLVPGGLILMDDSADGSPFGSTRTAHEFRSNPNYSVMFKGGNYLFRRDK